MNLICQPNTEHTLITFTVISTAELAVALSYPIKAERNIHDDSSTEVTTFENFPDFTSLKHSEKFTVGSTGITDHEQASRTRILQ